MTGPRVCVAVPCYNQEYLLTETLESLVFQDYDDLRIIVSDDASTDGTAAVAQDFARRFPGRVIAQVHAQNLGVTSNVRSIAPLIDGEYLCWFAGDDVCLPGKIKKQVAALDARPEAVLCYHDVDVFDGATGRSLYRYNDLGIGHTPRTGSIARDLIEHRCFIAAISAMIRRAPTMDILHRADLPRVSDWLYLIEVCERGEAIYLDEVLARYRRHPGNVTKIIDISDEARSYDLMQDIYPHYRNAISAGLARLRLNYTVKHLLSGSHSTAAAIAGTLSRQVLCHPKLFWPLAAEAATAVGTRARLYARTKRLFR